MTLQVWLAFVVLEVVLCFTPGADSPLAALARGFGVQAANPKALAFFVALVPQFIDVHSSVPAQVAILALTRAT